MSASGLPAEVTRCLLHQGLGMFLDQRGHFAMLPFYQRLDLLLHFQGVDNAVPGLLDFVQHLATHGNRSGYPWFRMAGELCLDLDFVRTMFYRRQSPRGQELTHRTGRFPKVAAIERILVDVIGQVAIGIQ
jgi:hypothetical protein